ncbi:hypothetical protein RJ640_029116 [Escallonia rubra]|uniref:F-box domain-containing protein n=1 Tax=Escallonia rubra TaxID=112253 RepID=A0AA88S8X9_9ASTE|nr:hypothetical protein RJ640_029116 [Escallonia rubra]
MAEGSGERNYAEDINFDITCNILLRLPVKSLMRCMCVCKAWYSVITSDSFISTQLGRPDCPEEDDGLFVMVGSGDSIVVADTASQPPLLRQRREFFSSVEDLQWSRWIPAVGRARFSVPRRAKCCTLDVVGSCCGVVCVRTTCYHDQCAIRVRVHMWNPALGVIKTLGHHDSEYALSHAVDLGFGFHNSDYKVVMVRQPLHSAQWAVEVYSLSMDSWREIQAARPGFVTCWKPGGYVKGAFHWLGRRTAHTEDQDHSCAIVSFDFSDEVFREVMLPTQITTPEAYGRYLYVYKDSLALYQAKTVFDCNIHLWVMEEYGVSESWTKLYSVSASAMSDSTRLGIFEGGTLIVRRSCDHLLYSSPCSYEIESSSVRISPDETYYVVSHRESLVDWIVIMGFTPMALGSTLPSQTNKPFASQLSPFSSTAPSSSVAPILQLPI